MTLGRPTADELSPGHGADHPEGTRSRTRVPEPRRNIQDDIDQARRDVLDGYTNLGRILSTPAINRHAEARRVWAIKTQTREIARMERNLLALRQEAEQPYPDGPLASRRAPAGVDDPADAYPLDDPKRQAFESPNW